MSDATVPHEDWSWPPKASTGAVGWIRQNLFSSWFNGALTILALYLIVTTVPGLFKWAIVDAVWDHNPP